MLYIWNMNNKAKDRTFALKLALFVARTVRGTEELPVSCLTYAGLRVEGSAAVLLNLWEKHATLTDNNTRDLMARHIEGV